MPLNSKRQLMHKRRGEQRTTACTKWHVVPIAIDMRAGLLLLVVMGVTLAGCASSGGAVPRPFPMPGGVSGAPAPPAPVTRPMPVTADGYSISSTALSLRGAPYRAGGADPAGFDCSGFVHYVFEQHGITMPRLTREQFDVGEDVEASALSPGDLVFFTTIAPGASHVGIVIGGDQFVHAPNSNGVVRVERLSAAYWSRRFVGAKRVVTP